MQPAIRLAAWTAASATLAVAEAATGSIAFLGQPVTMPLWAFVMAVLLPGEAFADLARAVVRRANPEVEGPPREP